MNKQLWKQILAFDIDDPKGEDNVGEYSFTTRLSSENSWSKSFTQEAIIEYKKFMYLAATSTVMVSPSEIVDIVWHQHLIFTQSYKALCDILGKRVQHIPSTHNKAELEKFKQAKEQTTNQYEAAFGKQPYTIWECNTMLDSLRLTPSNTSPTTINLLGIPIAITATIPAYFLLKPWFIQIGNPHFIIGLSLLSILSLIGLHLYNTGTLKQMVNQFDQSSFIFHLDILELIYLERTKINGVINGIANKLIKLHSIRVNTDHTLETTKKNRRLSPEEALIVSIIKDNEGIYYPEVIQKVVNKPLLINIVKTIDSFKDYVQKSTAFVRLYTINFIVCSILLILPFTRILTGVTRDKPIIFISIFFVILGITVVIFLLFLKMQIGSILNHTYKKDRPSYVKDNDPLWQYFSTGEAAFALAFAPLASYVQKNGGSSSGAYGSSCGSSCGSGCGSGCGGGCGGCGG